MKFDVKDLRHTFGETLAELGETHENLVVLDADLHTSVYTSLFRKKFPDRFVQCGIAEANMFSIAAGHYESAALTSSPLSRRNLRATASLSSGMPSTLV